MKADKAHITHSIKIARGQLDGILRMIEEDRYCVGISNQLLATQALLKRVNQEILRAHIRGCVRDGLHTDEPNPKLEEALQLLEKLVTQQKKADRPNLHATIADIAAKVGYETQGKFSKAFKDVIQVLPTEYRKMQYQK